MQIRRVNTKNNALEQPKEDCTKADVRLTGFGTFSVSRSKARKGRSPATGEAIKIKASNRASFKSGKTLKDRLN